MPNRPRFFSLSVSPRRVLGVFLPIFPNRRALYTHVARTLLVFPAMGTLVFLTWVVLSQGYEPVNVVIGTLVGFVIGLVTGSAAGVPASRIPSIPFLLLALLLSILGTGSFELSIALNRHWEYAGLATFAAHWLIVVGLTTLVAQRYRAEV